MAVTAVPSDMPGCRLKEIVTEGSWPVWLTDSGPAPVLTRATLSSGIRRPLLDRTYRLESARSGLCWNSRATCMIT